MSQPTFKRINIETGKFQANGRTYYVQQALSVIRYVEYQKLSNEVAFGTSFEGVHKSLTQAFQAINSGSDILGGIHKCREVLYNQINAIVDFHKRQHPPVLRLCALFINAEDEDTSQYDERMVQQKIEDWLKEGILIDDFFFLAANFIPTFKDSFRAQSAAKKRKENQPLPTDSTMTTSKSSSNEEE